MFKTNKVKRGLILAILMLLMIPMMVSANTGAEQTSGDFKYVDNGDGSATLTGYTSTSTVVDIPNVVNKLEVVAIGKDAFRDLGLTSVKFPDTLKTIGHSSFRGNSITELIIPNSVTEIDLYAFEMNEIENLVLSNNLEVVSHWAFRDNKLTKLIIPDSIVSVGQESFRNNKLEEITFSNNLETISSFAFSNNNLVDIVIPDTVTRLDRHAFSRNMIEEITVPGSVKKIYPYAFTENALVKVNILDGVEHIDTYAFSTNNITDLKLPNSLTNVGSYAFKDNNIVDLILPDTLRELGRSAFSDNAIERVEIPKMISLLPQYIFSGNQIKEIIIPANISKVEEAAFKDNPIEKVVVLSDVIDINPGYSPTRTLTFGTKDYIIYGNPGSMVQTYAQSNGKLFLPLEEFEWPKAPEIEEPETPTIPDEDITNPVENQTHANKATFSLFGGVFDLETSPIISFGNITFPTEITNYTSTFDGVFTVRDLRGTNEGWRVDVSATQFRKVEPVGGFEDGTGDSKLPTGTLSLKPVKQINRVSDNVGDMPVSSLNEQTIIDDGTVTVVRAEQGSGAGEYEFEFPEDSLTLSLDPSKIEVDKVNYPNTGTPYEATITWDLIQAP